MSSGETRFAGKHEQGSYTKLMAVREWIDFRFTDDSKPHERTVRRWITDGFIPGKKIGRSYYVYVDQEQLSTGNALADSVIQSLN